MVNTRQKSIKTPQKCKKQQRQNYQTTKQQLKSQKILKVQQTSNVIRTPSPKRINLTNDDNILHWAPKIQSQFSLSGVSLQKSKKNFSINSISKHYCYFPDPSDPSRIVSYMNEQTFSIVMKRPIHEQKQLLQQMHAMDKLIHRNQTKLRPFLKIDWVFKDQQLFQYKDILKIIQSIKIADKTRYLKICIQYQDSLLRISHIRFQNLMILNLYQCGLTNLQALTWMDCSNLAQIRIQQMHIHSINVFNKTNIKKLKIIQIANNKLTYSNISRMVIEQSGYIKTINYLYFPQAQLIQLYLLTNEQICIEDITFLVKMKSIINPIRKDLFYPNRIKQNGIFNVLERKEQVPRMDDEY